MTTWINVIDTSALIQLNFKVFKAEAEAHTGVPGNEKADIIAKQATGWRAKGRTGQRAPKSK